MGAKLWANRVFRVGGHRSDEGLPAPVLPLEPGARGVAMNPEYLPAMHQQALDNLYSYIGVWVSIVGGIIGSAGPFVVAQFWRTAGQ
jgi:hypothetical protein